MRAGMLASGSSLWTLDSCAGVCVWLHQGLCTERPFLHFYRVSLSHYVAQAGLNLQSSCLSSQSAGITGLRQHAQLPFCVLMTVLPKTLEGQEVLFLGI